MIAAGSNQYLRDGLLIQLILTGKGARRILGHKCRRIGITDRIFLRQPPIIPSALLRCHFGQIGCFRWRYDIYIHGKSIALLFIKFHRQFRLPAEREFGKTEASVLRCPHQHISLSCGQSASAAGRGIFGSHRIEFRIIVKFEFHTGAIHGRTVRIHYGYGSFCSRCIIVNHIDFGVSGSNGHYLFLPLIASKNFCMHQHPPTGRRIEPPEIKNRFGLASSQEIPFTVCPCLHPRMIIIGMSPTGRIYLTCRNTYRTECGNQKC